MVHSDRHVARFAYTSGRHFGTEQQVMDFGTFSYNQARRGVPEQQMFDEMLEQIELSETLGFSGAWFAEHHLADYSVLPSPNIVIGALSRRTKRLRLGTLVNVLPLHLPLRFA